eukprot:6015535-Pyramimonas_sp.AAC.1
MVRAPVSASPRTTRPYRTPPLPTYYACVGMRFTDRHLHGTPRYLLRPTPPHRSPVDRFTTMLALRHTI